MRNEDHAKTLERYNKISSLTELARLSFKAMHNETFMEIAAEAKVKLATSRQVMEDFICMLLVTGRLDITSYLDKDLERRK